MQKIILIICDGLADRPIYELGNKTPLEAAIKPNLDKLAKHGITGLMHTVDIGIRPGSDVAHLSLFGYDVDRYYTGRGPFEAVGYGFDLKPEDVAFRGNFATVDSNFFVLNRRAERIDHTDDLIKDVNGIVIDKIKINVVKGVGHRLALILQGKNLDGRITDIDPHGEKTKILSSHPIADNAKCKFTAKIINQFVKKSYEILPQHPLNKERIRNHLPPANIILVRGAGMLVKYPTFKDKYGLSACCIAGAGLYKGIAKLLGMDIINIKNATGKPDTDVAQKIKFALSALKTYDFVFVHIKGTDILAEDGDYMGKKKFIEKIDAALYPLVKRDDILIVVTADHTTSSYYRMHTADPVPVLIAGKNIHTDYVENFGERSAAMGKLGHIQGKHLMPIILDFIGRAPLLGA